MQDEGYLLAVAHQGAQTDRVVMALLLDQHPGLWRADEIARELGDDVGVADSLARLHGTGLVHRLEDFVFPTVAAVHAFRIDG
jgi:predicted transcriptional regulator